MDIDAVIAEAVKTAEPAKASPEAKTEAAPVKQEQETPAKVEGEEPQHKADSELTAEQLAKREANRKSHLDSKLAKMRRENRELREAMERNQAQTAKAPPAQTNDTGAPVKPIEDKFQTWGEYQDALSKYHEDLADWKIEQKLAERDKKTTENTKAQAIDAYKAEKVQKITADSVEFTKANPEFKALMQEHIEYFSGDEFPPAVEAALLEADAPILALFALMKEGRLESLEDMSPYRILMEIGKAEIRGESYLSKNKATNAPAPLTASKGTGGTGKALDRMSYEDLKKEFKLY